MNKRNNILILMFFLFFPYYSYCQYLASELEQKYQQLIQKSVNNLIFVEGGEFMMGDFGKTVWGQDNDSWQNSKPPHLVKIDSFSMSKYKITLKDYQLYLLLNGKAENEFDYSIYILDNINNKYKDARWQWNDVYLPYQDKINEDLPAFLYWREANDYCKWLGKQTGLSFGLPTEAQWEYAARNRGQNILYATDDGTIDEGRNVPTKEQLASYAYQQYISGEFLIWVLKGDTFQPMGLYPPTPLGFYDMTYNGWEWMRDYYGERYYQNSPQNNPQGESLPTIWRTARGLDPRTQYFGTTTSRTRFYENYSFFPLGFTARCIVNSTEQIE